MIELIYKEYLQCLNSKMRAQGRHILLLIDNFSSHELAIQLVGGLEGLLNIRIAWLPPNTTSHQQPMDQGIIVSFKLQYRRQWMLFIVQAYEANKDPNKMVILLKAIQWTRVAWEQMVTQKTIQKCQWRSIVIKKPIVEGEVIEEDNLATKQAKLQA